MTNGKHKSAKRKPSEKKRAKARPTQGGKQSSKRGEGRLPASS